MTYYAKSGIIQKLIDAYEKMSNNFATRTTKNSGMGRNIFR